VQTVELATESVVDVITTIEQVGPCGQRNIDMLTAESVACDTASDVRLIIAELATNAFEHGSAPAVSIGLTIDDDGVAIRMTYIDAGTAPDPNDAVMPPPTSLRGRGLALVAALASTVERTEIDGVTVTVVTLAR